MFGSAYGDQAAEHGTGTIPSRNIRDHLKGNGTMPTGLAQAAPAPQSATGGPIYKNSVLGAAARFKFSAIQIPAPKRHL